MTLTIPERMLLREWPNPWPKIDFGGCVLYAPLWRPDMQARGGRIVNGTGICTGSPLHLAVGANTVTVTQAGTFTVYMPEGGTVASGTMTVSASPVTVLAGIATTITTTGATGNITVTPGNIIRSKDSANRALTVTGTTWGSQGRTLDGTDDYITVSAWTNGTAGVTIHEWVKSIPATWNKYGWMFEKRDGFQLHPNQSAKTVTGIIWHTGGAGNYQITSNTVADIQIFHLYTLAYDGTNMNFYIDGEIAATPVAGGNTINPDNGPAYIGTDTFDGTRDGNAIIGEVTVYERNSPASEVMHYFHATKWRYV